MKSSHLAILIPCFNEEVTISKVVKSFQKVFPKASIYVYDNNSADQTATNAKKSGAVVEYELFQGKGHVVRRMFRDIDADIYLMVDGDDTYDAATAPQMVNLLQQRKLDMVVAARQTKSGAYPIGHSFGNKVFNYILKLIFKSHFKDIFSGYRVFSRKFVKSFPALTTGFDIETELSIHALDMNLPTAEMDSIYGERPQGSTSKLNTYQDGIRILWRIFILFKEVRPFIFFGLFSLLCVFLAGYLGYPILDTYLKTGLVPRLPTAVLTASLMIISFLSLTCGVILESLNRSRK
jgi:glycosyltransferase involved in cell wall biosynthesis